VVLVTGDEPTAVAAAAAGLARAAAEEPRSTLLVDTDAATCGAAATLTLRPGPGVAEVVGQGLAWTDVLVTSDIGGEHLLDVVTAGEHWAPRAPRLSMQDQAELRRLAARYELTVMVLPDLAALSATPDRSLVGLRALLVAQRAVTSADALRARAAAVTAAGAQVLGVVLWDTDLPPRVPHVEIAAAAHRLAERVRLGAHDTSEFPIPS
jgi:Mrp family chromosome partitioning ATPase